MGARKAAEQRRIAPHAPPSGRMCVWEGEAVEYGRNSTIRASSRAGSGPPNWADRPHTARALYSAQRAPHAPRPVWAFPKGWPYRLWGRSETRGSPVRARFWYPRTPRDGCALVGLKGGPYTSRPQHGWPRRPLHDIVVLRARASAHTDDAEMPKFGHWGANAGPPPIKSRDGSPRRTVVNRTGGGFKYREDVEAMRDELRTLREKLDGAEFSLSEGVAREYAAEARVRYADQQLAQERETWEAWHTQAAEREAALQATLHEALEAVGTARDAAQSALGGAAQRPDRSGTSSQPAAGWWRCRRRRRL